MIFVGVLLLIPIVVNIAIADSAVIRSVALSLLAADLVFLVICFRRAVARGQADEEELALAAAEDERFERESVQAQALIDRIEPDGAIRRVGGVRKIGVTIHATVTAEGMAPFCVIKSCFISEVYMAQYQAGSPIQMRFLQEDPTGTVRPVGQGVSEL